jgi:long-chain acyl-CoA synthetase
MRDHANQVEDPPTYVVTALAAMAPQVINDRHRQLMFLPLAHIWARLVQVVCITNGVTIYYSTGIPQLADELSMVRPTWIFSVPRVFEKIYNSAKQKADSEGKGRIFDRAARVAIDYSVGLDSGGPNLWTRLQHALFDRLVFARLRAAFGGELKYAFSGGAPLGIRLGHFFRERAYRFSKDTDSPRPPQEQPRTYLTCCVSVPSESRSLAHPSRSQTTARS